MKSEKMWDRIKQVHDQLELGDQREFESVPNETQKAFFYRVFNVPKRRWGWERTNTTPSAELKSLHRELLVEILNKARPHQNATAFFVGRSILLNAKKHHKCNVMYKIDIKDFFDSITVFHVRSALTKHFSYLQSVQTDMLSNILTYNSKLPQGAPTSPHISNLVMYEFDDEISQMAANACVSYSRYADDITFSGNDAGNVMIAAHNALIKIRQLGFQENIKKTKFFGEGVRKIVTGLDVSSEEIRPTKKFRKSTEAKLRVMNLYGKLGIGREIRGKLAFWESINPTDKDLIRMKEQYKSAHMRSRQALIEAYNAFKEKR